MPYCHYLPKETKTEFKNKVNRDSTYAKIADLVKECDSIQEVCKHE